MVIRSHDLLRGVEVPRVSLPFLVSTLSVKRVDELSAAERVAAHDTLSDDTYVFPVFHLASTLALRLEVRYPAAANTLTFQIPFGSADSVVQVINDSPHVSASITSGKLVITPTASDAVSISVLDYSEVGSARATDPRAPLFRYAVPDIRGVSFSGDVQATPSRSDGETVTTTAGVARYEERTSASLNRGLRRISDNVDELDEELNALVERHMRAPYRSAGVLNPLGGYLRFVHPFMGVRLVDKSDVPLERVFPAGVKKLVGSAAEVTGEFAPLSFEFTRMPETEIDVYMVDESTVEFVSSPLRNHLWMPLEITKGNKTYPMLITEWISVRRARISRYRRYLDHMPALTGNMIKQNDVTPGEQLHAVLYPSPYVDGADGLSLILPEGLVLPAGDLYVTFTRISPLAEIGRRRRSIIGEVAPEEYEPEAPYDMSQAVIRSRSPFDNKVSATPILSQHAIRNAGVGGVRVGELGTGHTEVGVDGRLLHEEDAFPVNPSVLRTDGPLYIKSSAVERTRRGYGSGTYVGSFFVRDRTIRSSQSAQSPPATFTADDAGRLLRVFFPDLQQAEYAVITRVLSPELVETSADIPALYSAASYSVYFTYLPREEYTHAHSAGALFLSSDDSGKYTQITEADRPRLSYKKIGATTGYAANVTGLDLRVYSAGAYATDTTDGIFPRRVIFVRCGGNTRGFSVLSTDCRAAGSDLVVALPPLLLPLPQGNINVTLTVRDLIEVVGPSDMFVNTLVTPLARAQESHAHRSYVSDVQRVENRSSVGAGDAFHGTVSSPTTQHLFAAHSLPRVGSATTGAGSRVLQGTWLNTAAVCVSGDSAGQATMTSGRVSLLPLISGSEVRAVANEGQSAALRAYGEKAALVVSSSSTPDTNRAVVDVDGLFIRQEGSNDLTAVSKATIEDLRDKLNYLYDQVHKLKLQNEALHSAAVLTHEAVKNMAIGVQHDESLVTWAREVTESDPASVPHVSDAINPAGRRVTTEEIFSAVYRALLSSRNCAGYTHTIVEGAVRTRMGESDVIDGATSPAVLYRQLGTGAILPHELGYKFTYDVTLLPASLPNRLVTAGYSFAAETHLADWHPVRAVLDGSTKLPVSSDIGLRHREGVVPHRTVLATGNRASPNLNHECPPLFTTTVARDAGLIVSPTDAVDVEGMAENIKAQFAEG